MELNPHIKVEILAFSHEFPLLDLGTLTAEAALPPAMTSGFLAGGASVADRKQSFLSGWGLVASRLPAGEPTTPEKTTSKNLPQELAKRSSRRFKNSALAVRRETVYHKKVRGENVEGVGVNLELPLLARVLQGQDYQTRGSSRKGEERMAWSVWSRRAFGKQWGLWEGDGV